MERTGKRRTALLFVSLTLWFTLWMPGLVWVISMCLGGKLSWVLIEAVTLLLYSLVVSYEVLLSLAQQEQPIGVSMRVVPVQEKETVKETVARLKEEGVIRG